MCLGSQQRPPSTPLCPGTFSFIRLPGPHGTDEHTAQGPPENWGRGRGASAGILGPERPETTVLPCRTWSLLEGPNGAASWVSRHLGRGTRFQKRKVFLQRLQRLRGAAARDVKAVPPREPAAAPGQSRHLPVQLETLGLLFHFFFFGFLFLFFKFPMLCFVCFSFSSPAQCSPVLSRLAALGP